MLPSKRNGRSPTRIRMSPTSNNRVPLTSSLVSAGNALSVDTEDWEYLDVNLHITGGKHTFLAFIVTGDSMDDAIKHGDIVFVDTDQSPRNGDIVVCVLNGYNHIKIFQRAASLYLVPKNKNYDKREISECDHLHVAGVVKGVVRKL